MNEVTLKKEIAVCVARKLENIFDYTNHGSWKKGYEIDTVVISPDGNIKVKYIPLEETK